MGAVSIFITCMNIYSEGQRQIASGISDRPDPGWLVACHLHSNPRQSVIIVFYKWRKCHPERMCNVFRVKSQRLVRPSQTQVAMTAGAMLSLQPNEKGAVLRRGRGHPVERPVQPQLGPGQLCIFGLRTLFCNNRI